jgi:3-hydroxyacyl-CoA dehydrogenase
VADRLVAEGRFGQKTRGGYYRYEQGSREPLPDPAVDALIEAEAARLGVPRRAVTDAEIVERCMLPLVNEASRILEEGNALRPGDVDVVWVHGYGFPRYRGGPMRYADELGLPSVLASIERLGAQFGPLYWQPAPLLVRLAGEGRGFDSLH